VSAAGLWYFGIGHEVHGSARLMMIGICAAFFLLGLLLLGCVFRYRLTLQVDEIELTGLSNSETMRRDDLLGYRTQQTPNGPSVLVLVPRSEDRKPLKIPGILELDETFCNWLKPFPDLDERDAKSEKSRLADDPALGATPEERAETLKRVKSLCRALTYLGIGVSLWAWFYPQPYRLVIALLLVLPWSALYIASRYHGFVVINEKRRNQAGGVGMVFLFPGLVLALRAVEDMNALNWQRPLLFAVAISGLMVFAAGLADTVLRKQRVALVLMFSLSLAYGYGAAMETNAMLDRWPATVFATKVRRKYVSSGKHTNYHLEVAPWGPHDREDNLTVSRAFYDAQQVGEPVCIALRSGALGIEWYAVGYCQ
jgi:hypothetical protein